MPIPKTRQELTTSLTTSFAKLLDELQSLDDNLIDNICVDEWSIKDLIAVRAWWTKNIVLWIKMGQEGKTPVIPAPGYSWKETPRLNSDIVKATQDENYISIFERLQLGYQQVVDTIEQLNDRELLDVGIFSWSDKWPVSRWISVNTVRQYTTARTFIRKVKRQKSK